jgi:hypothetical protein
VRGAHAAVQHDHAGQAVHESVILATGFLFLLLFYFLKETREKMINYYSIA